MVPVIDKGDGVVHPGGRGRWPALAVSRMRFRCSRSDSGKA